MEEWDELQAAEKKCRKILIAMDGSKHSVDAFEWYVENIHKSTDHVILAYCPKHDHHTSRSGASSIENKDSESQDAHTKRVFRSIEELANKQRIRHILQLIHEPVGESIINAAKHQNVDLIIAGSKRQEHPHHNVGSTSNYITRYSHVPVMLYKYDDPEIDHKKGECRGKRARAESCGEYTESSWNEENDAGINTRRQRSISLSERMKALMKL